MSDNLTPTGINQPSQQNQPPAAGLPAYRPPEPPAEPAPPSSPAQSSPGGMSPYQAPSTSPALADGGVSYNAIQMLVRTRGWVRFLSVIGFLFCGLCLLLALVGGFFSTSSAMGGAEGMAVVGVYGVIAILYFFPSLKLWQYASWITRLQRSQAEIDLETALDKQRSFWKFTGIITLLVILFYVVAIAIMVFVVGSAYSQFK